MGKVKLSTQKKKKLQAYKCATEVSMGLLGGKYKVLILWHLMEGVKRYNEIAKFLPCATPKMLSTQLKELESDGLIKRVLYPVIPPKTEYSLSELGKSAIPMLEALSAWGESYCAHFGITLECEKSQ